MRQKIELYIISLWFLFLLLLIKKVNVPLCYQGDCKFIGVYEILKLNVVPTVSLFFLILGGFFYLRFDYQVVRGAPALPKKVTRIEDIYFENLAFLITYIIPLVGFDLDGARNRLMLFLMLTLIGVFYVKANIFYTNPSLAVLGYRIYKIDTVESKNMIVIIKGRLRVGDDIYPRQIDENIFFAKATKQ
jgi:hypothetical protein